jgi:hypothetical protein
MTSRGSLIVVKDRIEPIAQLGPPQVEAVSWRDRVARQGRLRLGTREHLLGTLDDGQTATKRKELADLLAMLDLMPIDGAVIDRAKSSFAVNVRALAV